MRNVIPASVYVMQAGDRVKIGRSSDPEKRRRYIQTTAAERVALRHESAVREDASLVEGIAHKLLADKRLAGEWFDISVEDAVAAIERALLIIDSGNGGSFRLPETIHIRVDDEFLAKLDDVRAQHRPVKTRAELIRHLVTGAWEKSEALQARQKGKR